MKSLISILTCICALAAQGFDVQGQIQHANTDSVLPFSDVTIEALHKWQSTDSDGKFFFKNVPSGTYELLVIRTGFQTVKRQILVDQNLDLIIAMSPDIGESAEVLVEAKTVHTELEKPVQTISGANLRKNLAPTIAETISDEAGISFRSMGSAPSRPVLRGLGGDRLLILEDNGAVGDMSAASSDHAVAIDPLTSNHVDIVRGPESFLFGSNTIGGVVNVVRGAIPSEVPSQINGSVGSHVETVNSSFATAANVAIPFNNYVFKLDGSKRGSSDVHSPEGRIKNSAIETQTIGFGSSLVKDWGLLGTSFSYYKSDYGIPPDLEGGHPDGVNIDLKRIQVRNQAEFHFASILQKITLSHRYNRYQHAELESAGLTGQEFGIVSQNIRMDTELKLGDLFGKAKIGMEYNQRNYVAAGRSNTPETNSNQVSVFAYTEYNVNAKLGINASLRIDAKSIEPTTSDSTAAGLQRPRTFRGLSGGLAAVYHVNDKSTFEASLVKSFRPPTLEELFSEGPHLAAYNFEIGNSDLSAESGIGLELGYVYAADETTFSATVFRNQFSGFISSQNTGKKSKKRASLFEYRYVGVDAFMYGFEVAYKFPLMENLQASGNMSYTEAEEEKSGQPLPEIPPFSALLTLTYDAMPVTLSADVHFSAEQDRLSQFENSTPMRDANGNILIENGEAIYTQTNTEAYTTVDLSAEYSFLTLGRVPLSHMLTVSIDNLFNTTYRNHLNDIKLIFPEPSRNFKLLYTVYF